jgi:hypothetical protein
MAWHRPGEAGGLQLLSQQSNADFGFAEAHETAYWRGGKAVPFVM